MKYHAEATSIEGFIQQIACCYLRHGYWFYVMGKVPDGKSPVAIDEKLIGKYRIDVSESTRARHKKAGRANLQYIRHESTFVILATKGEHRFFAEEADLIRDIRRVPLGYAGYSISYKHGGRKKDGSIDDKWHAHVAIDRQQYLNLRAWFAEHALCDSAKKLALAFYQATDCPVRAGQATVVADASRGQPCPQGRRQTSIAKRYSSAAEEGGAAIRSDSLSPSNGVTTMSFVPCFVFYFLLAGVMIASYPQEFVYVAAGVIILRLLR
jgi:hypothetical protein